LNESLKMWVLIECWCCCVCRETASRRPFEMLSVSALEVVVNEGLHACLNTGHVVSHGVHASLSGVDLDDVLKLGLASLQLLFPEFALGLAIFNQHVFWVFTFLEHLLHIAYTRSHC